jgi:hypothetical protein
MKNIVFISILFTCSLSWSSGNRVGNGGDVIKCAKITQLLDIYEGEIKLKKFKSTEKYKEIITAVLSNLQRLNPNQAKQYTKRFDEMTMEIEFRSDIELTDIKDEKNIFKAKGCKLLQIAVRRNEISKDTKRFVIDEDLWKELNETNKAALLLHELIYEHLYKLGEVDSQKARILNAYLFSAKANEEGPKEYWELVRSLKVPIYR